MTRTATPGAEIPDDAIVAAMHRYGGSFVTSLAVLYGLADADNRARLKRAFPHYWQTYRDLVIAAQRQAPAATLTHSFPWDSPGRLIKAFCGVTVGAHEYSSTPTCPRCAAVVAQRDAAVP